MTNLLLTHEQADFDAVASLLGSFLLNRNNIPVLPRRINRNVRSFLDLYTAELPFIEAQDFSTQQIDAVTLVDTQSLVTLKGMVKKTSVHVIDHHKLRTNIPSEWDIFIHELGACSTIFVESIEENNLPLTVIQATLLLLGIYEDTGSLTFTRTTPRDVRAVSYLMEQGASLHIANNYLYPPLSKEQRRIFDQLLRKSKTVHIQGCDIVLSKANAEQMVDEVSSAAHKLVDLLDPDALILTISTSEGIRLVARSTTNQIDVSRIAEHFGGGGHKRAAAALLRRDQIELDSDHISHLDYIFDELNKILPEFIKPAITVGQIMSRNPLILSPNQTAQEAAKLMQKYGYEGFPVVESEKIVGLLTRRSVDRALAHKLNLQVGSLMQAGDVWVKTSDTLEKLQYTMSVSEWGQVPVKDPQTQQIVGIVTRTDLIKTLANGQPKNLQKTNLASHLNKYLSPARLALLKNIAHIAYEQSLALYIVGGFVRDLLLDRPSPDLDFVVEGNAISLAKKLQIQYGGNVVSHKRFGTAKWQITEIKQMLAKELLSNNAINPEDFPDSIDLISARTEFYDYPTALPTVESSSIKLDLHRRDFSINTMALRLDNHHYGDLYDYWGGLNDLNHGFVRVLHSLSFVDDPTRMLRAVRFEQRFNFSIEKRTLQLMEEAHSLLGEISGDRIRHEINLIFSEESAVKIIERLNELNLLKAIHPDLLWNKNIATQMDRLFSSLPDEAWDITGFLGNIPARQGLALLIWLSQLPLSTGKAVAKRLRANHKIPVYLSQINWLVSELDNLKNMSTSEICTIFDQAAPPALFVIFNRNISSEINQLLKDYIYEWKNIKPFTDGLKLKEMNIRPGPVYKEILALLKAAWLDGEIKNKEEELFLLEKTLIKYPHDEIY